MSSFWSWYITILSLANIFACVWLIKWAAKKRPGEAAEHETTGHSWDGLEEYNNPMPRWWLWMFYITIVFGLIYLALYPGLGAYKGLLGWTSHGAWSDEVDRVEERVAPLFAAYAEQPIPELARNAEAMQTGRRLFGNNCAMCHGSDGGGHIGFPNIANNSWQWGGSPEQIHHSILRGRNGIMPAFGAALGDDGVEAVSAYLFTLDGRDAPQDLVDAGREHYQRLCVACHGPEGKGNTAMGAPNLTDGNWTYGGGLAALRTTLYEGRNGQMPAQEALLGADRVHLLTAYVYSLSMDERYAEEAAAADEADVDDRQAAARHD